MFIKGNNNNIIKYKIILCVSSGVKAKHIINKIKGNDYTVRGGADYIALLWGNGLYCKLKLKREEEELIIRSKYLNKYSRC